MAIIMGLVTVLSVESSVSVACSSVHCMDDSVVRGHQIIAHGQPRYRPWETL